MEEQVLIASYPRSGNSFVRYLVEQLTGQPTELAGKPLGFDGAYKTRANISLPLVAAKTHQLPISGSYRKCLFLLRNYKEAIPRHHCLTDDPITWPEFRRELWKERDGPDHADAYLKMLDAYLKFNGEKMLLYYDDLVVKTNESIARLADFFDVPHKRIGNLEAHRQEARLAYVPKSLSGDKLKFHSLRIPPQILYSADAFIRSETPRLLPFLERYFETKPLPSGRNNPIRLGIMQGRLTPRVPNGPMQFFPQAYWEKEFDLAGKLGLDEIELVLDEKPHPSHPLWKDGGRSLVNTAKSCGISMRHILADYFLFVDSLDDKVDDFKKLAEAARAIGAESVEIPLVEKRTVSTASGKATTTAFLSKCLSIAEHAGIKIGLETDLPPEQVLEFIKGFGSNLLIPSYDSGNSASSGFDLENEFRLLGAHIRNIHIKDRMPNGGPTTPLGTGATKFKTLFSWLMANKYDGSLTLQAARRDGSRPEGGNLPETSWIASQAAFVRELLQ